MKKNNLTKIGNDVELTAHERMQMRSNILAHIQHRVESPLRHAVASPLSALFWNTQRVFAGVLVIVMVVGSTEITKAAQVALPGDVLYTVKRVSEQVHTSVVFSDSEQVRIAGEHAVRRLHEGAVLQKRGALTPEVATDLSASLQTQVAIIGKHLDTDNVQNTALTEGARAIARVEGYANIAESAIDVGSETPDIRGESTHEATISDIAHDFVMAQEFVVASQLDALPRETLSTMVADQTKKVVSYAEHEGDSIAVVTAEVFGSDEIYEGAPLDAPLHTLSILTNLAEVEAISEVERSVDFRDNNDDE